MKKSIKFHYVQDWGTYSNQTLVCVAMSKKEIGKVLKRLNPKMSDDFLSAQISDDGNSTGYVYHLKGKTVLFLQEPPSEWRHWETLVHETYHLVSLVFSDKSMNDEEEASAYQQQFLFRAIRRRLQERYFPKKKPIKRKRK